MGVACNMLMTGILLNRGALLPDHCILGRGQTLILMVLGGDGSSASSAHLQEISNIPLPIEGIKIGKTKEKTAIMKRGEKEMCGQVFGGGQL